MAWGSKDHESRAEAQVEILQREVDFLRGQVGRLQEALIAKESPIAYSQIKADEAIASEPEGHAEARARIKEEAEVARRYISNIEAPFFTDADDMVDKLSSIIGIAGPPALHNNKES